MKYGPVVELVEIVKDGQGLVSVIKVKVVHEVKEKLKGYIHWVSKDHSMDAIVRVYNYLFQVPEPKDDWEKQINPESLVEKSKAKVWTNLKDVQEADRFQFERLGYFVVDRDSRTDAVGGKLVFNRVVELKESKEKKVNTGKQ